MKLNSLLLLNFFLIQFTFAQNDLNNSIGPNKIKIDGVAAVVGDYVILESDVDKTLIDLQSQGVSTQNIGRCSLLGKLMEDKLYAHHAEQDSLEIDNNQIYSYVDRTIDYFVNQLGSLEKVLDFYKKKDEQTFRNELFEINKINQLSEKMQTNIVDEIEITPEEVRLFFSSIPKYERPVFGAELEIAQIVVKPKVSDEDNRKVVERLESIRNDIVVNGSSFATKAILYSQDPGSRATGGKYTLNRNRPQMDKDFRDAAYRLREGEISDPFKTQFGWHIVKVERIRGQEVDVRHILLIPEITNDALSEAKKKIDIIRKRIVDQDLTFEEAAKSSSDEEETRNNGGVLINPTTGDTRFELTKMDPVLYGQAQKLKDNEISFPLLEEDERGIKKYKIIKVSNRFDEHIADYSQDYIKIKDLALKEKQLKQIQNWMVEKIDETYININKDNIDCNFINKWVKK
ncbi:MAG: peptidylprolyl isomerase [Flavobacteriaceae bacterium]|jgi:peptidyl-prolyl cis-trans isomerase SurA|nr:peptidylprolyl isomerase [Flavobacteriaceae bacterium]MDG2368962.1 peptidylprolyl isomerase [Flavobacteriaceae bacterium]|tara:strand:- start:2620 stop:3996 length:1377 start_codon:yes stop_codon:yes gene_type:complete